ncbi:LpqB family beta-propeller domain-containing protein [Parafrigoribacterium mesophilum]|uniref:LpqB family beta-propeller domain-containing protein n=1 Tax=Parafrigoribacterium mesophilum TaxID=433646 RepID=UPI0031FE35B7
MPDRRIQLRRILAGAAIVVAASVLSACVGIPASGPVVEGPTIDKEVGRPNVYLPEGPVNGADQEQILRGFISAFVGPQNDYKVARQFLTTEFSGKWEPRSSVLVRSGGFSFTSIGENTMTYSFKARAAIDATGSYSESPTPLPQSLTFTFAKEGNQWRISEAPNGIVLSDGAFPNVFGPQTLYFLDPSLQHLVPDLRWFPSGTAPTRIVNALLAGPPPWLQKGAVTSVFPDGTQLTSPKVVLVNSGVARIDLSSEALAAKGRERQLMKLQLTASLSGLASVRSIDITAEGSPYPISDSEDGLPVLQRDVDGRAVVSREGQFGYYANGKVTPIDQLSSGVLSASPTAATVDVNRQAAAVLGSGGVYAVRPGSQKAQLIDDRPGLIPPTLDGFGYVWSVPADNPGAIRVFGPDAAPHDIAPTLPKDARVVSFDVSRDGARIVVLLQTDDGPRVIVSAIIRDPDQRWLPTTLGSPTLDVVGDPGTAIDATWLDELSVATLTSADGITVVTRYEVGGMRSSMGRPGDGIRIVGGNDSDNLRVLSTDHVIQVPRGSSWSSTEVKVDFIATQH